MRDCSLYTTVVSTVVVIGAVIVTIQQGAIPDSLLVLLMALLAGQGALIVNGRVSKNLGRTGCTHRERESLEEGG